MLIKIINCRFRLSAIYSLAIDTEHIMKFNSIKEEKINRQSIPPPPQQIIAWFKITSQEGVSWRASLQGDRTILTLALKGVSVHGRFTPQCTSPGHLATQAAGRVLRTSYGRVLGKCPSPDFTIGKATVFWYAIYASADTSLIHNTFL